MKKVIGNKLYDTEKAERIGSDSFSVVGDFHYWFRELYRTRSARFFFYGGGGPMTDYAVNCGSGTTSGSERIWMATREEAREWLAGVDVEKAEEVFGPFEEG